MANVATQLNSGIGFSSGDTVTSTKLNQLVNTATVTGIVNADVSATAGIIDSKLATISTAGKVSNSATTATSANTASAIVARDASGNFSAGTITATSFSGGGSSLTSITAGNLSGTLPSGVLANSSLAIGTTSVALNRASANQSISGITSINMPGSTSGTATIQPPAVAGTTTITLPAATDTLVGRTTTDTLTNKSVALGSNTVTGTKAQFDTAVTDDNFAYTGTANAFTASQTVTGTVTTQAAATQDAVVLQGRSGGTSSRSVTLTPTSLSASRTITLPDVTGTVITTGDSGTVTSAMIADGTIALADLATAVANALVPVGAVQAFARSTAPSGWLAAANGNTIGSASSGAANASADYSALFTVLWDNWTNADLPILDSSGASSTRGASASADFSANKRLPLPDLRGIFVRGSGDSQTISGTPYSATFAAKQRDAFQGHYHTTNAGNRVSYKNAGGGASFEYANDTATVTDPTSDGANGTPRTASETRPANIALLYCIKF